jgi:hypothetical protein
MTPPTPLTEFADRVERLTGPCRETDARIVIALDLRPDWTVGYGELYVNKKLANPDGSIPIFINTTGRRSLGHPSFCDYRLFTESIDDAMTLAPKGLQRLVRDHDGRKDFDGDGKSKKGFASICSKRDDGPIYSAYGATPAIALVAASLHARAASENSHG